MNSDRRFVVVSRLPSSGKTTVSRTLAALLRLPLFDKDDLLEQLFEAQGVGDAAWRRQLSRDSDVMLQSLASSSTGAVICSFWHVAGMPSDSGTPVGWLSTLSSTIVNLHCECPPDVAADRFTQRRRHAGHLDDTRTASDVQASIQALAPFGSLEIGERVIVHTTRVVTAEALLRDVEAAFERCKARLSAQ